MASEFSKSEPLVESSTSGDNQLDSAGDALWGMAPALFFDWSRALPEPSATFLTPDDVIEKLRADGFSDAEAPEARAVVEWVGLAHFLPYLNLAKKRPPRGSLPSVRFAHDLLRFDRILQACLIEHIGLVELRFKKALCEAMVEEAGPYAHRALGLVPTNVKAAWRWEQKLKKEGAKNGTVREALAKHGDVPVWTALELSTLGNVSRFYEERAKGTVWKHPAEVFGLPPKILVSWLNAMTSLRNACAHFDPVAVRPLRVAPRRFSGISRHDNTHSMYMVIVLARLLRAAGHFTDGAVAYSISFAQDFSQIMSAHHDCGLACGFPWDPVTPLLSEEILGWPVRNKGGFKPGDHVWFDICAEEDDGTEERHVIPGRYEMRGASFVRVGQLEPGEYSPLPQRKYWGPPSPFELPWQTP